LQNALDLEKQDGPRSAIGFFLAMARWQVGEEELARADFDRAVEWMEKGAGTDKRQDEENLRFRTEATALLARDNLENSN
jgi:hypothetical protein